MTSRLSLFAGLLGAAVVVAVAPIAAQAPAPAADTVTVVPGPGYRAGPLHRLLLGSDYRALWTAPLRVPVLDLAAFAGGLTPVERGGGRQTRSLRLRARDGREFTFRSVDKDPSGILPEELRETLVEGLVQDQISSAHPVAPLSVAPILDAVGVLHVDPTLVVMPDHPALGEFREDFKGVLGFIEERPDDSEDALASFAGASLVVGSPRLLERVEEDLEVVDAGAFLTARLTDLYLGDWDRHADQWRWARFGDDRAATWKPIPRDRDQVFSRMDGWLLALARQYYPQFVKFGEDYPDLVGLTWNGRDLDRRLLAGLEWPAWDSVAADLVARLDDGVLDDAVARMPDELRAIDGDRLRRILGRRREGLPRVARRFYELLAEDVDIHTSDAPELALLTHSPEGALDVLVTARDQRVGDVEVFRRRFHARETREVRLFLHGGADSVRVTGARPGSVGVRVLGGDGADVFIDAVGGAHFYDTGERDVFVEGPGSSVDRRDYDPPPPSPSPLVRDWGTWKRFPLWGGVSPGAGLLLGMGAEFFDFGFREEPYARSLKLRGAWGTRAGAYRAEAELRVNRENSGVHFLLGGRASGLDILRFHGFGNETVLTRPEDDYRVELVQYSLEPRIVLPLLDGVGLALGPSLRYADTRSAPAWLEGDAPPYGMGSFAQAGVQGALTLEGRDRPRSASRGGALSLRGAWYPTLWDVEDAFGWASATGSLYLSPWEPLRPTLALRAGVRKALGPYPFHEASYLGDAETVRLGTDQRFGGEASAHANAELRLGLTRAVLVLPADVGVSALFDVGRVWLDGEDSTLWHRAWGGGVWLAFLRPENTLSFALVQSDEGAALYGSLGFAF